MEAPPQPSELGKLSEDQDRRAVSFHMNDPYMDRQALCSSARTIEHARGAPVLCGLS